MVAKKNIRFLIMDVDGTLTDGKIYIGNQGEMMKAFDIKDGYGIYHLLRPNGIEPIIITGRSSEIVKNRAAELKITRLYQGISEKLKVVDEILQEFSQDEGTTYSYDNIAYIGDDLIDLPCMQLVGITGCPSDAHSRIIEISDFVSKRQAGNGAVREFIDWLIDKE